MSESLEQRSERLASKYGCQKCGLIGCSCEDIADTFSGVCKKCRSDPCSCGKVAPKTMPAPDGGYELCRVCRRAMRDCICTSHESHHTPNYDLGVYGGGRHARPYPKAYIEMLVNEGLHLYYQRDAEGLARWLRRVLP